jgi:hypothetical protein
MEATVGDPGTGNGASQSGGVVQIGGGNTATGSLGAAQVSHSRSQTTAHARRADTQADVAAPTSVGGSGTNSANGSVVATQVGSGNSSGGSTGAVQIRPSTAGVAVTAKAGPAAPESAVKVSASGEQVLGDTLGVGLSELGTYPGAATVYALRLVQQLMPQLLPPGVSVDAGLRQLLDTRTLTIGEDGDDIRVDLGTITVQLVSLTRDPAMSVGIMGTEFSAGALAGVPNNGEPSASNSTGVVQAGGGNSSADSVGVVQVGSLQAAPDASLRSEELGASGTLRGGTGVPSGNNSVDSSAGVIQVGGVSSGLALSAGIDGLGMVSAGSSGAISESPTASLTPTGSTAGIGGTGSVGGSGNNADGSIGALQIGGGNNSTDSIGTAQSNAPTLSPTASAAETTVDPTVNLGGTGSGSNTASGSVGVAQVGTSNTAGRSIGVFQLGPTQVGRPPGGGTTPPGGGTTLPAAAAARRAAARRPAPSRAPLRSRRRTSPSARSKRSRRSPRRAHTGFRRTGCTVQPAAGRLVPAGRPACGDLGEAAVHRRLALARVRRRSRTAGRRSGAARARAARHEVAAGNAGSPDAAGGPAFCLPKAAVMS